MTQALNEPKYYTPAEYLALEDSSKTRHEYLNGEIRAMAGASYNHNVISFNLTGLLYNAFDQSNCQAFPSDMKVWVEAANLFTYPDVAALCSEPEFYQERDDIITNPRVVFEILSASTKKHDLGDKLTYYRSIATLQNYVLIDQKQVLVRNYERLDIGKWLTTFYGNLDDVMELPSIGAKLSLHQIYNRVRFQPKTKPNRKGKPDDNRK